jgi:hypothetical protein
LEEPKRLWDKKVSPKNNPLTMMFRNDEPNHGAASGVEAEHPRGIKEKVPRLWQYGRLHQRLTRGDLATTGKLKNLILYTLLRI